jgi:hypothetical protein
VFTNKDIGKIIDSLDIIYPSSCFLFKNNVSEMTLSPPSKEKILEQKILIGYKICISNKCMFLQFGN